MQTRNTAARYHALDSLRAAMMLLGIYLHVVVGYSGEGSWPYRDPNPTSVLNFTLGIIHAFRMPAFFVMAGFFGALLWNRRGVRAFVSNRASRIALPFAFFWIWMFPLTAFIVVSLQRGPGAFLPLVSSGELWRRLHPLHLWFLEYLILLYAAGAVVAYWSRFWPARLHNSVRAVFRWALLKPYAPLLMAALSLAPLASMHGNLKDCDGFMPEWRILSAYIVPFGFGWLLYAHRDLLPRFERHIGWYLVLAVPAFFLYGLTSGERHPWIKSAGNVAMCWFLVFSTIGLFLKHLHRASPLGRYLSDASYWMYIMHLPVVVLLQVAFVSVPLPALAKIPLVLAVSTAVLIVSYDWFVRPTWIGAMLNGRRYPRRLPEMREDSIAPAAA